MNAFLLSKRVAAVAVTAVIAATAYQSYQGSEPGLRAPSKVIHAPIQVRRLSDGSLERGLRNELASSNWSGYEVANFQTGATYTSAQATWVVPAVRYFPGFSNEDSATWVGIGGFCESANCTSGDNTLIQLGTAQNAKRRGTSYYAWYEMIPASPIQIPLTIRPGDTITASLTCALPCSAGSTQSWTLSMTNGTTTQSWTGTFQYASSLLSAEWIEEAPSSFAGILPLADYVTLKNFVPLANDAMQNLSPNTNGIVMHDPHGQTSNPSGPNASGFDVCWGSGSLTPCQ